MIPGKKPAFHLAPHPAQAGYVEGPWAPCRGWPASGLIPRKLATLKVTVYCDKNLIPRMRATLKV